MYYRMICNDIKKSKLISLTTTLFVAVATMLVALVVILAVNLSGAIDTLMVDAEAPHFLQMHTGKLDDKRLATFAESNELVKDYQVIEFLTVEGSAIQLGKNKLTDSIQDNGFTTQSKQFDFLLGLDGKPIQAKSGELYVPIGYMKDGTASIGDQAIIQGKTFNVAGFLRDAQMNSPLASSKRFLVSEADYQLIKPYGTIEHLIEFRVRDLSKINEFETAYTNADLEMNGPTITYQLFKVLNGLSDGIMIAIILMVSILVVIIAFMCIRFTLLTKIEEDYREIGVMKAIGLQVKDIKKIYLAKYAAIAFVGGIVGLLLSFALSSPLLENIRLYMGEGKHSGWSVIFASISAVFVFLLVIGYTQFLLRRFKKISAATAIRNGGPEPTSSKRKHFFLKQNKWLPTNIFLGIKDVLSRKKMYVTMLIVLILSSFIMIVPWNTYNTISSDEFTKYLGFGKMDMMVSLYQSDEPTEKGKEIQQYLSQDKTIDHFVKITSKSFKVIQENGVEENIMIELGNHSAFPIEYSSGHAPKRQNEIALSTINAESFEKGIGDKITILKNGKKEILTVCGIYSNIFNGGKTAKVIFKDDSASIMWLNYYVKFKEKDLVASKKIAYAKGLPFAKMTDAEAHLQQTFGSTISSMKTAAIVALFLALFITGLIMILFMKLLVAKDKPEIAIIKAIGFTNRDITRQYVTRSIFILIIGLIGGTLLANTLGQTIAGMAISSFGVDSIHFVSNPIVYIGCPLLMLLVTLLATKLGTDKAGEIQLAENLKE